MRWKFSETQKNPPHSCAKYFVRLLIEIVINSSHVGLYEHNYARNYILPVYIVQHGSTLLISSWLLILVVIQMYRLLDIKLPASPVLKVPVGARLFKKAK